MDVSPESPDEDRETPADPAAEPDDGDTSTEGSDDGGLLSSLPLPFAPDADDDSPLGDSDQHSDA